MAMVVVVMVRTAFWNRDLMNVNVTITKSGLLGQARVKFLPMTSVLAYLAPTPQPPCEARHHPEALGSEGFRVQYHHAA